MSNPDNASLWVEADVFVAPLGTALPESIDEEFPEGWEQVGLLNGEDGFNQSREEEKSDHYAWGGILVRTARRNFKLTEKFSALEDNPTTRSLIWPGSPAGRIIVPRPTPVLLGFELREGDKKHRYITERHAEVDVDGDIQRNESNLTKYELLATIFPTADGGLFIEQHTDQEGPAVATGATAGSPGTWTPSGSVPPANIPALRDGDVEASPSSHWDEGDYVLVGSGTAAHWDGDEWVSGEAPGND